MTIRTEDYGSVKRIIDAAEANGWRRMPGADVFNVLDFRKGSGRSMRVYYGNFGQVIEASYGRNGARGGHMIIGRDKAARIIAELERPSRGETRRS